MTTTERYVIHASRTEYAANVRDAALRDHAARIGGVVVGSRLPVAEIHTSHEAWVAGAEPVATYVLGGL